MDWKRYYDTKEEYVQACMDAELKYLEEDDSDPYQDKLAIHKKLKKLGIEDDGLPFWDSESAIIH